MKRFNNARFSFPNGRLNRNHSAYSPARVLFIIVQTFHSCIKTVDSKAHLRCEEM